ncbi:hypothetical protein Dimus_038728 [Dionaea muscipula]
MERVHKILQRIPALAASQAPSSSSSQPELTRPSSSGILKEVGTQMERFLSLTRADILSADGKTMLAALTGQINNLLTILTVSFVVRNIAQQITQGACFMLTQVRQLNRQRQVNMGLFSKTKRLQDLTAKDQRKVEATVNEVLTEHSFIVELEKQIKDLEQQLAERKAKVAAKEKDLEERTTSMERTVSELEKNLQIDPMAIERELAEADKELEAEQQRLLAQTIDFQNIYCL